MSKTIHREFYGTLKSAGLLDYGATIQIDLVHSLLGITIQGVMDIREYDRAKLEELAAIDYVRGQLLNDGKTIVKNVTVYRIPMPSENREFVERYIMSADNKLKRAIKLSANTPQGDYRSIDESFLKALRKRQTIADIKKKGDFLK